MTADNFKISLLPLDMAWGDIDENLALTAEALRHVSPDTDLAVLPEMFSTGFITEPTLLVAYDERRTLATLDHLQRWASHFGFALAGSMVACEGSKYYNRAFLVEPSGETTTYDKRHLFSLGGEARTYTPGTRPSPTVRYRGCNIRMYVCYDLRFPVWSRNVGTDYDLLIYPACWPDARRTAWEALLRARAIENQAWVAGCNRTGSDDYGTYSPGRSLIFNHWGDPVGACDDHGIVTATMPLPQLEHDRRRFPVWRDADTFAL